MEQQKDQNLAQGYSYAAKSSDHQCSCGGKCGCKNDESHQCSCGGERECK